MAWPALIPLPKKQETHPKISPRIDKWGSSSVGVTSGRAGAGGWFLLVLLALVLPGLQHRFFPRRRGKGLNFSPHKLLPTTRLMPPDGGRGQDPI